MSGAYTISAIVPFVMAKAAAAEGVDHVLLLRTAGLAQTTPAADQHVTVERYLAAWRLAMERIGDPAFPLRVAARFQLEDNEVFGFLALSCGTLFEAFAKTAAYRALYTVGARWELEGDAANTRLIWYPWPGQLDDSGYRAANDFSVADMANAVLRLGRLDPRPSAVRLMHAPPAAGAPAFDAHYGTTPRFGASHYQLDYPADLGAQSVRGANSRLRDYFDAACRELLAKAGGAYDPVAEVRRKLILAMDGGDATIEAVAKSLAMSPRTLQRRLAEEGTRYAQVLDDVRTEFAKRYLARGTLSASEVAFLVGFSEPPAFFKAFKRWTGMTPGAFQGSG